MHHTVSSSAVDLQAATRGLARRLASLRYFLDAAQEFLNYIRQLSLSEFRWLSEQVCILMSTALKVNHLTAFHFQIITLMEVKKIHDQCSNREIF